MGSKRGIKIILAGLAALLLFFRGPLYAQTGMLAPYSAFGPGYMQPYLNVRNMGLGGIGAGLSQRGNMNPLNPATYRTGVDTLSVRFDIGFNIGMNNLAQSRTDNNGEKFKARNKSTAGGLSNLEFYFPVCKWYKMGVYLLPLTDMFYKTSYFTDTLPNIGVTRLAHEGGGGLAKVGWGHSLGWGPVTVGANLNYIFGNITQTSTLSFLDDSLAKYAGSSEFATTTRLNGFGLDVGLSVHPRVGPSRYLTVGASYSLKSTVYGKRTTLAQGIYAGYQDSAYMPSPGVKGKMILPSVLRAGISYEYLNQALVGIDVTYSWWKEYEDYGKKYDFFRNTFSVNLGAELESNPQATTVARRFAYRIGGFFQNYYTAYEQKELYSYGISLGLGIPVRKSRSVINVGLQFGQTGALRKGQIRENYMRIGVSLSDLETWFVKPKYD